MIEENKIEVVKGTLFIDLDGTVLHSKTEEPLPFAVEKINYAYDTGYVVVLTTFRGKNWDVTSPYSVVNIERTLKSVGLKRHHIIWDSPSPRILINDDAVAVYRHPQDGSWKDIEL